MLVEHEATTRLFELNTMDVMEIASITGHKSLAMLKRYTHLQAARLVKKLEGNRGRGQQVVLDHLIPYPAIADTSTDGITIRVLDFDGLSVTAPSEAEALQRAQDELLRKLMVSIRDKVTVPPPDQYLDTVDESRIFMLDPLASRAISFSQPHTFL